MTLIPNPTPSMGAAANAMRDRHNEQLPEPLAWFGIVLVLVIMAVFVHAVTKENKRWRQ